jgi:hypothetical protein
MFTEDTKLGDISINIELTKLEENQQKTKRLEEMFTEDTMSHDIYIEQTK